MTIDEVIVAAEELACAEGHEIARADIKLRAVVRAYGRAQRERAAKVCDEIEDQAWALWKVQADPTEQGRSIGADHCADAIRSLQDEEAT